ncbi:MAG: sigma-54-dependent Fis family transcriptional regulator [Desulfuromonadaceae bacterium]|nr:sigma-54-dependent Fis family transcriptional regulator [Desulfuromonadaceae bacterium]
MTHLFTILAVDDDNVLLNSLRRILKLEPVSLLTTTSPEQALALIQNQAVHLLLLDLRMPGMSGIEVLQRVKRLQPGLPVLMLTGQGTIQDAVKAVKMGATDFLEKPCPPATLVQRIRAFYPPQADTPSEPAKAPPSFPELIGDSAPMRRLKQLIGRIAHSEASVLLHGETGTGKELVARAIHRLSPRNSGVFVPVDCATISEKILESELFGHRRGAFTGAESHRQGLFVEANGGTLFLDEIGEFQLELQAKLLRVLQERQVRPVGSNQSIPINIRIVAATNKDLLQASHAGGFREDLYYRLCAIELEIPPLRHRCEDIPALAQHFIRKHASNNDYFLSLEAVGILKQYDWPGNVRELENTLIRALALCQQQQITPDDLPAKITLQKNGSHTSSIADMEKIALSEALAQTDGNRREAAKKLGISEATLYRKLKKSGLSKKQQLT